MSLILHKLYFKMLLSSGSNSKWPYFMMHVCVTWFHPHVTSMHLNLEPLKSLVKYEDTVTSVHPVSLCIWANCSPDVNARSHLITLHSDVGVGVQVNLNWVWISSKIKNILIGWQSWLAVWFQSDCAISNGPGPPTDECLMEICLKETSSLEILDTRAFCICKHAQTIGERERKSKLITVSDGRADAESFWSDRKGQVSAPDPFWLFCAVFYFGWA